MRVALASDHAGFKLKKTVAKHLNRKKVVVKDAGCFSEARADYPDYVAKAARLVSAKKADFAVVVCSTGVGASIAANKVRGVRAALCWRPEIARQAREHVNANVLALPAKRLNARQAEKIVDVFLTTPFSGEARHARRVRKVCALER